KAMARHIRRVGIFLLLLVSALSSCNRYSKRAPGAEYEVTLSRLQHGDLLVAQQEAEKAYRVYEKGSPDWAWRFRVLQAETLVWQGLSKKALELLAEELPPSLYNDEAAVRRKIIQGLAHSFLQDFPQANRCLAEAETLALIVEPKLLGEVALSQGTF